MTWLLTIILMLNGERVEQPAGLMLDASFCRLAGVSMSYAIMQGTPGAVATWRCDPPGVAS